VGAYGGLDHLNPALGKVAYDLWFRLQLSLGIANFVILRIKQTRVYKWLLHLLEPLLNKKDGYRQLNVRQLGSLRPWDHRIRGKCYMDRKRIQCLSNASQHVPIYLQTFLRYSGISVASDWFSTVLVSK